MSDALGTILVVDDDESKRYTLVRVLKNAGFDVYEAANGHGALMGAEKNPDLVVLDVKMPNMDGYEVCRRIKSNPHTARIPVLQVSATFVDAEHRVLGLDSGADAYLSDAVSALELVATVNALLRARRAEQAALESELRYRTLAESLPQLIWTCDRAGECDYLSSQWVNYTGEPAQNYLGSKWIGALHPADRAIAEERWQSALAGKEEYDIQFRIRRQDGIYRWFQTRGVPLRDEQGHITRWLGTCTEIHAQKEAAEERARLLDRERMARTEAENANRLKDEFLATLSHELRTPLMAILGWAQVLKTGRYNEDQLEQALTSIDRNARAQSQLIDDLLDVSRIISGKLRLDVKLVDLVGVIQAAIDSMRTAADAKSIRLQQVLDPAAGDVVGDSGRLQQIIWNLLSNAIKFTPKGGRVCIGLARVNSHVELTVTDTGQGIDPHFLPHVFDRFRQADPSSRRTQAGLGLGLAIVRHLVELHGGTVAADSLGKNKGSVFTVRLPLSILRHSTVEEDAPELTREVEPEVVKECPPALKGVRILVVEDDQDARDLLVNVLEECDAIVAAANSVQAGLALFEQLRPDMVISDIGMPEQDGFDLIRGIREREVKLGGRVPAVALTAFARAEDRKRALLAGFQMHVSKPVIPSELLAIVASLTRA